MNRTKRKSEAHIIGEKAVKVVKKLLPIEWTIRELTPDYGIDLEIELFDKSETGANSSISYDTLGEHLFVQVKGSKQIKTQTLSVKPRYNVEGKPLSDNTENGSDKKTIDVVVFDLETPELVTVQRMGAALPVLLFLVDIETSKTFYICLNDYIEKVILHEDTDYSSKSSKRFYIPIKNEITTNPYAIQALRFYAKRSKLYAAFQKFNYQKRSLDLVYDEELIERSTYFAKILLRYDFWTSKEIWPPIKIAHQHLENLVDHSCPDIFEKQKIPQGNETKDNESTRWTSPYLGNRDYSEKEILVFMQIRILWDQLANLGAMYEEVCREWMLPTHLGIITSKLE